MKFYIIFTLLFAACQSNALTVTDSLLSPRLEVTPYVGGADAVLEAQKLLLRLQEYNLIGEVNQAKFVRGQPSSLLFEMSTPLQATNVIQAWRNVLDGQTDMKIQQVVTDFFPRGEIEFRTGR